MGSVVKRRQQSWIDDHVDRLRLTGGQIHLGEADQTLGGFPSRRGRLRIDLPHRHAATLARVAEREVDSNGVAAPRSGGADGTVGKAGVAEPVTEGEKGRQL